MRVGTEYGSKHKQYSVRELVQSAGVNKNNTEYGSQYRIREFKQITENGTLPIYQLEQ